MFIEITYYWSTRRGETFEEIRVPVKIGKEAAAHEIVDQLRTLFQLPVIGPGIKSSKTDSD
jgi:hypothetical protein